MERLGKNVRISAHDIAAFGDADPWVQIAERCSAGDVVCAVSEAADRLLRIRDALLNTAGPPAWMSYAESEEIRPLHRMLREDPFASRAASTPRGYPGDAVLVDRYGVSNCQGIFLDLVAGRRGI